MRCRFPLIALFITITVATGCDTGSRRDAERRREEQDRNSAAFRAGQAAHEVAREADKAAAEAARKLDESAREAREGWRNQEQKHDPR
jgi:hypothetical protein